MRHSTKNSAESARKIKEIGNRNPHKDTLATYSQDFLDYVKLTPNNHQPYHASMLRWIDEALRLTPPDGSILEIGSATPRDARYMKGKGYKVQCSDAVAEFVTYLRECGENAILIDILNDKINSDYDMIFANAVIQHLTEAELKLVLKKIYNALSPGKIFAFSTKQGDGEEWIKEKLKGLRYIHYWQPEEIRRLVEECGFRVVYANENALGDLSSHHWLLAIVQKP